MEKKIYLTYYEQFLITAVYEDEQLVELYADEHDQQSLLDRIFIAKVKKVVKNINAAFVDLGGVDAYYSLSENTQHIFMNPKNTSKLVPGDEILVQVSTEAIKTKPPAVTSMFSFAGKYMVLKAGKPVVSISNRIQDKEARNRLKQMFEPWPYTEFGIVIRTKAALVDEKLLKDELEYLKAKYEQVLSKAKYLTCFSEVYKEPQDYIKRLLTMVDQSVIRITTDDEIVFNELKENKVTQGEATELVFYNDQSMSLPHLLSLPTQIERALKPQVWMKNGGSLVITPTEAMVVIDVNTGHFDKKKDQEETFFKINMAAAKEIIHQLRLRNLSGIIIIDFIDMKSPEKKKELMNYLSSLALKEPIKTVVVDMTKLNLVEMTRRKERRPLHEQFQKKKIR